MWVVWLQLRNTKLMQSLLTCMHCRTYTHRQKELLPKLYAFWMQRVFLYPSTSIQNFKCLYILIAYIFVFSLAHITWLLAKAASWTVSSCSLFVTAERVKRSGRFDWRVSTLNLVPDCQVFLISCISRYVQQNLYWQRKAKLFTNAWFFTEFYCSHTSHHFRSVL